MLRRHRTRDPCDEASVRIEYARAPDGARLVFHRSDAFADGAADNPEELRSGSEALLGSLSETEEDAYKFLAEHGALRTAEVEDALGLTSRGTLKVLKKLVEKNIVVAQGATSDRIYRLRDNAR